MSKEGCEALKAAVVDLVKDFVNEKGEINNSDLRILFGYPNPIGQDIASALAEQPVKFVEPRP